MGGETRSKTDRIENGDVRSALTWGFSGAGEGSHTGTHTRGGGCVFDVPALSGRTETDERSRTKPRNCVHRTRGLAAPLVRPGCTTIRTNLRGMAEPQQDGPDHLMVVPRNLVEALMDDLSERAPGSHLAKRLAFVMTRDKREHEWQGRHLAHRPVGRDDRGWVVTLVAEETAEVHLLNLIETVAMLASRRGAEGVSLGREREVQRALMKRGIAVTID